MRTFRTPRSLNRFLEPYRRGRIGFVPTMGALHDGHLELVRRARRENDAVVVSIFVNPTQFGPREDFARYPRPFARDSRLLARERVHALFAPAVTEMYPHGYQTRVQVGPVAERLCGKSRPTHFSGVATVVTKLLSIVRPARLYLGQKDYQQVQVLRRVIADLNLGVAVRMVPTVREPDGLAMSSRNVFLTPAERAEAPGIYRALRRVQSAARAGVRRVPQLRRQLAADLSRLEGARIDYAEILDAETLAPVVELTPKRAAVAACAVFYSKARLIDNIVIRI